MSEITCVPINTHYGRWSQVYVGGKLVGKVEYYPSAARPWAALINGHMVIFHLLTEAAKALSEQNQGEAEL